MILCPAFLVVKKERKNKIYCQNDEKKIYYDLSAG